MLPFLGKPEVEFYVYVMILQQVVKELLTGVKAMMALSSQHVMAMLAVISMVWTEWSGLDVDIVELELDMFSQLFYEIFC